MMFHSFFYLGFLLHTLTFLQANRWKEQAILYLFHFHLLTNIQEHWVYLDVYRIFLYALFAITRLIANETC